MSVLKNKRNKSGVQFLDTAQALHIFTLRTCVKFPKRYTFYISQDLVNCASTIHALVKKGNSIFPQNAAEVELRRQQFIMANAELQSLVSKIGLAYDTFPIKESTMLHWLDLINTEINLIKGVLKTDALRYKKLVG